MRIDRSKDAARVEAPQHDMTITISYNGLRKVLRRLGFSSWSSFRRYSGLSEITVSDLNQGRFIILEKILYIATVTGTDIGDLIEYEAKDRDGAVIQKDAARNAARAFAKKDLAAVKKTALNTAWKLGQI